MELDRHFPRRYTQARFLSIDRGMAAEARATSSETPMCFAFVGRSGSLAVRGHGSSLWLVVRGSAHIRCSQGDFPLQKGDWIALPGDVEPTVFARRNAFVLSLILPGEVAPKRTPQVDMLIGRGSMSPREARIALRLWCDARKERVEASDLILRALHFVATLQEGVSQYLERCPGRSSIRKAEILLRLQRARLYLEGNQHRTVPLSELARLVNFSVWYLTKTFTLVYGEGPRQMTFKYRLETAGRLLGQTSLSVAEVGEKCGFQNPCSFSRAFRAHYGTTPSEFRTASRRCKTDFLPSALPADAA